MPQVDHAVGYSFHGIVVYAMEFKSQQQAFELVFPSKYSFDRSESFFEDFLTKSLLSPSFQFLAIPFVLWDIRYHINIKNSLAIFT